MHKKNAVSSQFKCSKKSSDSGPAIVRKSPIVQKKDHVQSGELLLKPEEVNGSLLHSRSKEEFADDSFKVLRKSIIASGGNLEAVTVKRVELSNREGSAHAQGYELLSGERRFRICTEMELPLRVTMVSNPKTHSFVMDRLIESAGHKRLALIEIGRQVALLIRENKYSLKEISALLALDRDYLNHALFLASMPEPIINAFSKPSELLRTHARTLRWSLAQENQELIAEANAILQEGQSLSTKQVFNRLWSAACPEWRNRR